MATKMDTSASHDETPCLYSPAKFALVTKVKDSIWVPI